MTIIAGWILPHRACGILIFAARWPWCEASSTPAPKLGPRFPVAPGRATLTAERLSGPLDALSPIKILERGYALVFDDKGALVKDASQLAAGHRDFRTGGARQRSLPK